jgi:X-X-X-Leu-X-X-Gly heptad repeat protein
VPLPENTPKGRKIKLAIAIANGASISEWASENDVPRRTAYRWASDPKVRAKVASCRHLALDRAIGQMASNVNTAADGIQKLAEGAVSESVRLSALRTIFSNMMAVSEFADLQVRMTQLEEQLGERARATDTGQAV